MKVTINASDLPALRAASSKLSVLDKMLARRGHTKESLPRGSRAGKKLRANGVPADSEWQRIDQLPRRVWHTDPEVEELVELLTADLKTPQGTQRLWPIQAIALKEIHDCNGLVGGIRVSGGKTLVSLLAATILEHLPRPMLFVPAKSIRSGKTDKAYREARQHWRIRTDIQFVSYEMLQQLEYADLLEKYNPGIVIGDEVHKWRRDSARGLRAEKFHESHPHVPFIELSGTLMAGHIVKDVGKLCNWALGEGSPVPRTWKAQKDWADALEVGADATKPRMLPGALERWCEPGENDLEGLQRAYGRRYTQTPGVVVSSGDALGQTLSINVSCNAEHDDAVEKAFVELRGVPTQDVPPKAPDGWILVDAHVIWATARSLELGFYYKPNPRPPTEWTLCRQAWASYCRERIKVGGDIETELQVANECRALGDEAPSEWVAWLEVRGTFELNVEPVWLSDRRVLAAAEWLKKEKGLCWVAHRAFGERLSQLAGVPFFSREACDVEGNSIVEYPGGPAIVSFAACSEDLNLQDRWHSNLVPCPPSDGQAWEQFLARTHRFGQRADEVTCDVWVGCIENVESIDRAREKERGAARASLDDARKLLVAEWDEAYVLPRGKSRRWTRPAKG